MEICTASAAYNDNEKSVLRLNMTAKEYLLQVQKLKIQAENKKKQYEKARESLSYLDGIRYDKDKIQTSPKDNLSETIVRIVALEDSALAALLKYNEVYAECVDKINALSRKEYVEILSRRYLDDDYSERKFERIACVIDYSYRQTCRMHGEALVEFEKKYLA